MGLRGTGGTSLSHLSQVLVSESRCSKAIHSSDLRMTERPNPSSSVFFFSWVTKSFYFPVPVKDKAGDSVQADGSGFFLHIICSLKSILHVASDLSLKPVTSCGSRLCEWGLTPPLVSGHWWFPPTFPGTPPSAPGTRGRCRNRSPTGSRPAGKQGWSEIFESWLAFFFLYLFTFRCLKKSTKW